MMNPHRQHELDIRMENNKNAFLRGILGYCKTTEESVYVTCSLALDYMRMHYKAISHVADQQQAKAAFKVAMDALLVEYGMSVVIHEFT